MLHHIHGIVLRTVKFSETSVIATIYTDKFGLQSYMINGVRSAKSKNKMSMLQPLTLLNLVAYHRENKNLQRIKEIGFYRISISTPFDVVKGSIVLFLAEILSKTLKEEEANPALFEFLVTELTRLDQCSVASNFHLRFLLKLAGLLGFSPSTGFTGQSYFDLQEGQFSDNQPAHPNFVNEPYSHYFHHFSYASDEAAENLHLRNSERRVLLGDILMFYELHLANFQEVRSARILEAVLG